VNKNIHALIRNNTFLSCSSSNKNSNNSKSNNSNSNNNSKTNNSSSSNNTTTKTFTNNGENKGALRRFRPESNFVSFCPLASLLAPILI